MAFVSVRERLEHITDGIEWIQRLAGGKSLTDYRQDRATRDAVERNLERISEASRHIPADFKAMHPEMDWPALAHIGNILRHAYEQVDHAIIWQIIEHDLPALHTVSERLLAELGDEA